MGDPWVSFVSHLEKSDREISGIHMRIYSHDMFSHHHINPVLTDCQFILLSLAIDAEPPAILYQRCGDAQHLRNC